jgi:histone deacetylase 8
MLKAFKFDIFYRPLLATDKDLVTFHSQDYIDKLFYQDLDQDDLEEYGFQYDCALYDTIRQDLRYCAGATIYATECLINESTKTAIHFDGGRHHAKRDFASGFCHLNDIVLAILKLQSKFKRIVYVDLDVHHGDGVEEAFAHSKNVTTISIHLFQPGFFPGTGRLKDLGSGKGKNHTFNIPLKPGITSESYLELFQCIVIPIINTISPDAIVLQCGCDGLAKDPLGGFNLSSTTLAKCCKLVKDFNLPTLYLGGGGYIDLNAARCWTLCALAITGQEFENDIDIPDDFVDWPLYAPDHTLTVSSVNMKDENSRDYLEMIKVTILDRLLILGQN